MPALVPPDMLAPDTPALAPPDLVPVFTVPVDAPAGTQPPPGASAPAGGALAPGFPAFADGPEVELEVAIRAAIAAQQKLTDATMLAVQEMSRERRRRDRPIAAATPDQAHPADVQDFDVASDLLAGVLG